LQIFYYGVVHEQAELVTWFYKHSCQEIGHFFKVEVGRLLAEVDGQNVGEGGIVTEGLEVNEFDEDIGVLLGIAVVIELFFYVLNFA
jgi:hypothetical protein